MPERDTHDPSTLVPAGRRVRIPGRGTTFVRDVAGIDGAPTVILLHGLGATAAINWPGASGPCRPGSGSSPSTIAATGGASDPRGRFASPTAPMTSSRSPTSLASIISSPPDTRWGDPWPCSPAGAIRPG